MVTVTIPSTGHEGRTKWGCVFFHAPPDPLFYSIVNKDRWGAVYDHRDWRGYGVAIGYGYNLISDGYAQEIDFGSDQYPDKWFEFIRIGQLEYVPLSNFRGGYHIFRGHLFFDTSILSDLPSDAIITSAVISLFGTRDAPASPLVNPPYTGEKELFDIVVRRGIFPYFPYDPLDVCDYDRTHYTGDGGRLSTADFKTDEYNDIVLNGEGVSWINTQGVTHFALMSSHDIGLIKPTMPKEGYVDVWTSRAGLEYQPLLTLEYETEAPPEKPWYKKYWPVIAAGSAAVGGVVILRR